MDHKHKLYAVDLSDEGKHSSWTQRQPSRHYSNARASILMKQDQRRPITPSSQALPTSGHNQLSNTNLTFQFGASDIPRNTPTYASAVDFDATDHKIDSRASVDTSPTR